jgi:hypothetical protein
VLNASNDDALRDGKGGSDVNCMMQQLTYVFPGIRLRPAKFIMIDPHHMAVLAMQLSQVEMFISIPRFDV